MPSNLKILLLQLSFPVPPNISILLLDYPPFFKDGWGPMMPDTPSLWLNYISGRLLKGIFCVHSTFFVIIFFLGRKGKRVCLLPFLPPTRGHIDELSEQTLFVSILPSIFPHNLSSRRRPILTGFFWVGTLGAPSPHEELSCP